MAIVSKDITKKRVIDLTGPDGNAFVLLGIAKGLCKQLDLDTEVVLSELMLGDYEDLISLFDKYFGSVVDLER